MCFSLGTIGQNMIEYMMVDLNHKDCKQWKRTRI